LQKDPIAGFPVDEIDCDMMQRYIGRLVNDGYSMSTIKKQYNLLTAYWKHGMSRGMIQNPVYLGVSLPVQTALQKVDSEVRTYTPGEQRKLVHQLMMLDKPQYGVIMLMLEAGLRVGEALALKWEDVLWSRKAIYVRRTLIRMSNQAETYVQDSPKSKTSVRKVPLSARAFDVLERLYNKNLTKEGFIFAREDDSSLPYSYSSVEFHIKALCKDLGISYKGMHAFRHTFATNCYNKGCDVKILSKLLGHADVSITYNIYIHLYGDALDEMRKVID
jgi:integrase